MKNEDDIERVADVFEALGSTVRLQILSMLEETKRPLHIKAISRELKIDYAAVYRHVKVLESTGLVELYEVGRSRVLAIVHQSSLRELIDKARFIAVRK